MYTITKRQKDIIVYLHDVNSFSSINDISERFNISTRTLRYDLDQISYFLNESQIKLIRKSGDGIKLDISESQFKELLLKLQLIEDRILSVDERNKFETIFLLCNQIITIDKLATALGVSKQTIQSDLVHLEESFKTLNIKIIRKTYKGCYLEGNELQIRRLFGVTLKLLNRTDKELVILQTKDYLYGFMELSNKVIKEMEDLLKFTYVNTQELTLTIAFNLYRSSIGKTLLYEKIDSLSKKQLMVIKNMFSKNTMKISNTEALEIQRILLESKISSNSTAFDDDESESAQRLARFILEGLEDIFDIKNEDKTEFINNLRLHLKITFYRIRNRLNVENQILDKVKISIPLIYEYTKSRIIEYEKNSDLFFNEEEIAYIAMYVGAILENHSSEKSVLSVLVICNFGNATSKILISRLQSLLPEINIIGPLSTENADHVLKNEPIDLIITTAKFIGPVDTITVNPILSEDDIDRIKSKIYKMTYLKQCNSFIHSLHGSKAKSNTIADIVLVKYIRIDNSIQDWKTAIKEAAKPLLNDRLIQKSYIDRMISAVEEFGNYMVILPETAFVHAGINDGVNENCISILILQTPILFGSKTQENIRNIIVIGSINRENNAIVQLANIFEKDENRSFLRQTDLTVEKILAMHD